MGRITRRRLLERGALFAGAGFLASCSGGRGQSGAFDKLATQLDGRVVLPRDADYERARKIWNSRFDSARPRAVVEVAGADDVETVVRFARDHGLRLIARNGRHSFGGYSTGDGVVVVDVSRLNRVELSADARTARVGTGATLLPTYQALWSRKKAIPGGTCPTVGVTGLATCGGIGYLTRLHGPTCDSLVSAELVDADGRLLRASADENPDLFWALRGAGSGNFGIVTSLTFRTVPVDMPFTAVSYEFPWAKALAVLSAWQDWVYSAPRQLASDVLLVTTGGDTPSVTVEVVYAGPAAELDRQLDELLAAVGTRSAHTERSTSGWVTVPANAYCKGLRPDECRDAEVTRSGRLPRLALYAKSDVAAGPWAPDGFAKLVDWIDRRQRNRVLSPRPFEPTYDVGKVLIEACDGALDDVPRDATAFVHRGATRFVSQYQVRWREGAEAANIDWANRLFAAIEPFRSGMSYQGYIDTDLPDWQTAYYGENLPRLRRIKSRYDPDDFFRFARSIPPA